MSIFDQIKTKKTALKNKPLNVKIKEKAKSFLRVTKDSIILRRLNYIGMKMRIYMERQKAINSVEFLRLAKQGKYKLMINNSDYKNCIKLNKDIKREIAEKSNVDVFKQFHKDLDPISSWVLGFMTSVTYMNADLWQTVNTLMFSNELLKAKLAEYDHSFHVVKNAHEIFRILQSTDYDILYKKYKSDVDGMGSLEKFKYLTEKAEAQINDLEDVVTRYVINLASIYSFHHQF